MSVYCSSFNYLGLNSLTDHNLMVAHFEPDNGEMDAFLGMDPIYTESFDGTRRIDYGARFNSVATVKITMIKRDHSDFSEADVRKYLKWLTGARANSYLDLVVGEEIRYSFLGRVTGMYQQKMDARTVGLSIEFSSVSPWAYSPVQTMTYNISANHSFDVHNPSDDLYTYVYLKIKYTNKVGDSVVIENTTLGEKTIIKNLAARTSTASGETVTLDNNMMISSDKYTRIFGNDFNYVWPRLKPGDNHFEVYGANNVPANGTLVYEFIYMIKIGDCAIETVQVFDPICDDDGNIIKDRLDWDRIDNHPNTLAGYGITDGATVNYVNAKIDQITDVPVSWSQVTGKPTNLQGYGLDDDVYTKTQSENLFYKKEDTMTKDAINILIRDTKTEFNNTIAQQDKTLRQAITDAVANLQIDENELNSMLKSVLT